MMQPTVSIIIPVYNTESNYLRHCIESVTGQSYTNLEILVIDDKSTRREVCSIVEECARTDRRIKFIRNRENHGVCFVRKQGIDLASGAYICCIDSDDWIENTAVEQLVHKAVESGADIVLGDYRSVYNTLTFTHPNTCKEDDRLDFFKSLLTGQCCRALWGRLYKSTVFDRVDYPVFEGKNKDNDVLLSFLLAHAKLRVACLNTPIYNYIQRTTSITHTLSEETAAHSLLITRKVCELLENQPEYALWKEEVIAWKMYTWLTLLIQGIRFNETNKPFRKEIRTYWQDKNIRAQLTTIQKATLALNSSKIGRIVYLIYQQTAKKYLVRTNIYRKLVK
ncbi:MAG: glycosyltransferase family 2 protein [Culturomica sp.]|jgi:glycosyltransferase involved in cell wall biosynthesis|nr:glycosyltransferase family 2 protein [Culturomica sp.]